MSVRAKLTANFVREGTGYDGKPVYRIDLQACYDGSPENKAFFASTPSASISLFTVNEEAAKQFEEGKSYFVDFTLAE